MSKFQKDKIINMPIVNNIIFFSNGNDNFYGLLTNQVKQGL
jgi:hypothetical protein